MVVRKISEMYDLKTTLNRLGVLGIHTPSASQIERRWRGDFLNHRFYRLLHCNIRLACASVLPADPLQIGTVEGTIAPQDIMNPLLYRAVTNESWNALVSRLYGSAGTDVNSLKMVSDAIPGLSDADCENMYYALLSSDEWRKAMPQQGLSMSELRPLVYPIYGTYGAGAMVSNPNSTSPPGPIYSTATDGSAGSLAVSVSVPATDRVMRGPARPMPHFSCTVGSITYSEYDFPVNNPQNAPRTYVAAIALPPGKLQVFYFRLIIDWFIQFEEPVSLLEKLSGAGQATDGSLTYSRQYTIPTALSTVASANDVSEGQSVETVGTDSLDLIMEK